METSGIRCLYPDCSGRGIGLVPGLPGRYSSAMEQVALTLPPDTDFLDFGCSRGGSLRVAAALFGGQNGLGVDIDPAKVAAAQEAGAAAIVADATALSLPADSVS